MCRGSEGGRTYVASGGVFARRKEREEWEGKGGRGKGVQGPGASFALIGRIGRRGADVVNCAADERAGFWRMWTWVQSGLSLLGFLRLCVVRLRSGGGAMYPGIASGQGAKLGSRVGTVERADFVLLGYLRLGCG